MSSVGKKEQWDRAGRTLGSDFHALHGIWLLIERKADSV
jgi:hypothetical protein